MRVKKRIFLAFLFLPILFVLGGCGKNADKGVLGTQSNVEQSVSSATSPSAKGSSTSLPADKIALKVGPYTFTVDDFYAWYALNANVPPDSAKDSFLGLPEDKKKSVYDEFVKSMLAAVAAIERGYNKYPDVKSMQKIYGLMLSTNKMLQEEGSTTEVAEDDVRDMYNRALDALRMDLESNSPNYENFLNTELAKIATRLGFPILDYMVDWRTTIWKIEVDSSSQADAVMGRFYQEKAQNNGDAKEAFRSVARETMGPAYVERVSTASLVKELQDLQARLADAKDEGEKRKIKQRLEEINAYFNLISSVPVGSDPVRLAIGDKVYLFFLPKEKKYSLVSWEELPAQLRQALERAYKDLENAERIKKIVDSVRSHYESSIEKHFENL